MGPCYYEFPRWQQAGLLQPIDTTKLKKTGTGWRPRCGNLPGISAGPGKVWFVPHYWGNTSITFRTDLAPEYVGHDNWNILFDPKYKGRVAVLEASADDTVPFIAHMIGIDAYTMSPADWQKQCRPNCASWSSNCVSCRATIPRWRKASHRASWWRRCPTASPIRHCWRKGKRSPT